MAESKKSEKTNSTEASVETAERHAANAANALDAKLSGPLAPLEKSLNDAFGEKASYQLPKEFKELLVQFAPWLALIGGVAGIFSAVSLWQAAHRVNEWADSVNRFSESLGLDAPIARDVGMMFYLAFGTMVAVSVLAFLAFPGLKARKKVGWNLLFYSLLVNVAYSIVSLFYDGGGFGSFVATLAISAVCLYVLFQLRSHYKQ